MLCASVSSGPWCLTEPCEACVGGGTWLDQAQETAAPEARVEERSGTERWGGGGGGRSSQYTAARKPPRTLGHHAHRRAGPFLVPAWTIAHWELQARKDRQTDRQTGTRKTHIKTSQRRKEWSKALCHHTYTHGCSQGLKISEVWGGVKNCAIITPNTTHYIH